jgi:hypothetical protein
MPMASPTDTATTDHSLDDPVAQRLVKQLSKSLARHSASGDAYVASVYGEWGIGKTYCLKSVHAIYQREIEARLTPPEVTSSAPLVMPVLFDPWRYEHEEHLVVPLLKTIELAMGQLATYVQVAVDAASGTDDFIKRNKALGAALKSGASVIGRVAKVVGSAVKFKASPFGVGVDIEGKAAVEQVNKQAKEQAKPKVENATHNDEESLYFDAQRHLEKLTNPKADAPLQFVLLVDDLDRCLPEKAIQVLESVKLFLNVPGFSFVLAVDDEVVERGIAHRYRDYRFADKDGAHANDAPISGSQYLEKIVHLPVHLPRWTRDKAQAFLVERYPQIYARATVDAADSPRTRLDNAEPSDASERNIHDKQGSKVSATDKSSADETLALVLNSVPLVPRKLIRLSEGIEFLYAQFVDMQQIDHWHPLHAARVVALQQLHPSLYRYVRQRPARYWRLFNVEPDVWLEPRYKAGLTLKQLDQLFGHRGEGMAADPADQSTPAAATENLDQDSLREQRELLQRVHAGSEQRGAGDPVLWFKHAGATPKADDDRLTTISFADLYFNGEMPKQSAIGSVSGSVSFTWRVVSSNVADLPDNAAAVTALLSSDAITRRELIDRYAMAGKQLPEPLFAMLLHRLREQPQQCDAITLDMVWLQDMAEILSGDQYGDLSRETKIMERWLRAVKGNA